MCNRVLTVVPRLWFLYLFVGKFVLVYIWTASLRSMLINLSDSGSSWVTGPPIYCGYADD